MKQIVSGFIAVALLISLAAYFTVIRPIQEENNLEVRKVLVRQHSYLLKQKLAIVEYIRLDTDNPKYEQYKSQIETRITAVTEEGKSDMANLDNYKSLKDIKQQTDEIYSKQEYTIDYLVDLSNLLKEYSRQIEATQ